MAEITKVSIIIPVYNTARYLPRCLDSVINQTLKDIEIICVNDCSIDNSLTILKDYASKDNRIKIIDLKENSGAGFARNRGIEQAKGEYLGFVDSDDFIDLDFYEKLYKKALETDADIVKSNLKNIGWNKFVSNQYYNIKDVKENKLKLNHIPTTIIRKKLLLENNIRYPENLKCAEDSVFEVYVSNIANKIEIVEEVCYYYVFHNDSLNHDSIVDLDKIKALENSIISIIKTFNDLQLDKEVYFDLLEDKYKYISTFCKNKALVDEAKNYIKKAEQNILYTIVDREAFLKRNFEKRVKMAWSKKYKEVHNEIAQTNIDELVSKIKNMDALCITEEKRNPKFVVSLTSFPQRMYDIHICLYSLLLQSLKPDEIVLYLANEQFPNKEKDIPNEVLELKKLGLKIKFTKDTRSYKKLIPALSDYPNDIIITADDDIVYHRNWFEKLYNAHLEDSKNILCHRAHKVKTENNTVLPYKYWDKIIDDNSVSVLNFATGCAGILYPPKCFYKDILKEEIFMKLAPNADDVWFWAMAILNDRKIRVINEPIKNVQPVNYDREHGLNGEMTLYQTNVVENDIQIKNVINQYPEILNILKSELKENAACQK